MSVTKIAVLISGLSYDSQRRFVEGLLESALPDGAQLYFFVCDAEDYHSLSVYETGEYNIYSLPDFSLYDAIIGYFDTIHNVDVVNEIINRVRASGKPCVSVNTLIEDFICLKLENQSGLRDIFNHLYRHHKVTDFFYISGARDNTEAQERLEAVRDFMHKRGLSFSEDDIYYGNYSFPSGYTGMDTLLSSGRPLPQAVVCANDKMAIGAITRCREAGIRVPDDLIVTGFDDSVLAQIHQPGLTTVRRSEIHCGHMAYELARDAVQTGAHPQPQAIYGEVLFSGSCGCPEAEKMNVSDLRDRLMDQIFRTETETYFIKTLMAEVTSLNNFSDFLSVFGNYTRRLNLGDVFINLCGDAEQYRHEIENDANGIGAGRDLSVYAATSTMVLGYLDGRQLEPVIFNTADIIPPQYTSSDQGRFWFVFPLHHRDHCFGSIVFGNKREVFQTQTMNLFALAVCNSLETILEYDRKTSLMNKLDKLRQEDPLTRIYNRAGAAQHWPELIQYAQKEKLFPAAIFMDIDDLKGVNDRYTHEEGDRYITAVADVIRSCCGPHDLAIRFGGDEFIVYTAVTSSAEVEKLITSIRATLEEYNQAHPTGYDRGVSIGRFICDDVSKADPDMMTSRADSDMYYEKRNKKTLRNSRG